MKILSRYMLVYFLPIILTYKWNITLSTNPANQFLNYIKGEMEDRECQNGTILIQRNIEQMTICTNSLTQFDDYLEQHSSYQSLDAKYKKCYRYFSTNTRSAKYIEKRSLGYIELALKQKGLFVEDFQSIDYQIELCSNQNFQSLLSFAIKSPSFRRQRLKQSFSNENIIEINEKMGAVWRKVDGKGFHQQFVYTIIPPQGIDLNEEECSITIEDVLPVTTYIDIDQLRPYGSVKNSEIINIEKPQYEAKQYIFEYNIKFGYLTEIHPSTYSFRHPVHFRYPTPNNISEYAEVNVHPISLMKIECRQEEYLLKEDRDMYRGVAKVPVGDSEKLSIVSLITFISEIMCSLLLVKELRS